MYVNDFVEVVVWYGSYFKDIVFFYNWIWVRYLLKIYIAVFNGTTNVEFVIIDFFVLFRRRGRRKFYNAWAPSGPNPILFLMGVTTMTTFVKITNFPNLSTIEMFIITYVKIAPWFSQVFKTKRKTLTEHLKKSDIIFHVHRRCYTSEFKFTFSHLFISIVKYMPHRLFARRWKS